FRSDRGENRGGSHLHLMDPIRNALDSTFPGPGLLPLRIHPTPIFPPLPEGRTLLPLIQAHGSASESSASVPVDGPESVRGEGCRLCNWGYFCGVYDPVR